MFLLLRDPAHLESTGSVFVYYVSFVCFLILVHFVCVTFFNYIEFRSIKIVKIFESEWGPLHYFTVPSATAIIITMTTENANNNSKVKKSIYVLYFLTLFIPVINGIYTSVFGYHYHGITKCNRFGYTFFSSSFFLAFYTQNMCNRVWFMFGLGASWLSEWCVCVDEISNEVCWWY